jgi:hypothetical protein
MKIWFSKARTGIIFSAMNVPETPLGVAVGTRINSAPARASRRTFSGNSTS